MGRFDISFVILYLLLTSQDTKGDDKVAIVSRKASRAGDIISNEHSTTCPEDATEDPEKESTCKCPENTTLATAEGDEHASCLAKEHLHCDYLLSINLPKSSYTTLSLSYPVLRHSQCQQIEVWDDIHIWDIDPESMKSYWLHDDTYKIHDHIWAVSIKEGFKKYNHYIDLDLDEVEKWQGLLFKITFACTDNEQSSRCVMFKMSGTRAYPLSSNGTTHWHTQFPSLTTPQATVVPGNVTTPTGEENSSDSLVVIIAGATGGAAVLLIMAAVFYCWVKRHRERKLTDRYTRSENLFRRSEFTQAAKGFTVPSAPNLKNLSGKPEPPSPVVSDDQNYQSLSDAMTAPQYVQPQNADGTNNAYLDFNEYDYIPYQNPTISQLNEYNQPNSAPDSPYMDLQRPEYNYMQVIGSQPPMVSEQYNTPVTTEQPLASAEQPPLNNAMEGNIEPDQPRYVTEEHMRAINNNRTHISNAE